MKQQATEISREWRLLVLFIQPHTPWRPEHEYSCSWSYIFTKAL